MTTGRRESCAPCKLLLDPPRDGIIRTSPGSEGSKDKGALPGMRGILLYLHYYRWHGDNEVTQTVFSGKLLGPLLL